MKLGGPMGLVLQQQRRAVEHAFSEIKFVIHDGVTFYLNFKRIELLGISVGVGTCSDLQGIDIAVLGKYPDQNKLKKLNFPIHCSGLTFLRDLTQEELVAERESRWFNEQPLLMVEGLIPQQPHDPSSKRINLILNGKKTSYVPI